MKIKELIIVLAIFIASTFSAKAKKTKHYLTYRKCFIGSTFFKLGKLISQNRPDFVQFNFR
jgi:hypothetical protein